MGDLIKGIRGIYLSENRYILVTSNKVKEAFAGL